MEHVSPSCDESQCSGTGEGVRGKDTSMYADKHHMRGKADCCSQNRTQSLRAQTLLCAFDQSVLCAASVGSTAKGDCTMCHLGNGWRSQHAGRSLWGGGRGGPCAMAQWHACIMCGTLQQCGRVAGLAPLSLRMCTR